MGPNYKQIYTDIINEKFPDKMSDPLVKNKLDHLLMAVDILKFDQFIFGETGCTATGNSQKLRAYDEDSILNILNYQKKYKLSNTQTAIHFKLSRNSIAKWKAIYKM